MPPTSDPITTILPGLVLLILIIAVPLAILASIILLSLYRRAVLRAMGRRANAGRTDSRPPESSVSPQLPVKTPLEITLIDSTSRLPDVSTEKGLYADLLRGPWRAAAVYAVAGLCYAIVTTIIFLAATKSGFHILSFLIIFWYYAWPVVITISLVAAPTWRTRLFVFSSYFIIIAALGGVAVVSNSITSWVEIVFLWLLTNFPAALLLLVFLNRRIQAVGPLVLTFMLFAATGMVLMPLLVNNNDRLVKSIVDVGVALGLGGGGIYLGLLLVGFVMFGAIGWLALQGIGSWYRRKKISEQSITIDAIWLLFGIFQSIGLIFEGERWFMISLLSFAIYKVVAWAGFAIVRRNASSTREHPSLLVLRVFSLGRRSERLFDVLALYWRFTGSIRLIAGPDLAATTMEPHEFLDFLSGKLSRRFIDSDQTLDLRISQMDNLPDHDGQFRVNDFFCYDDTWRSVLSRLVGESDAVLMDLRGFTSQNAGCVFEIRELVNRMPLEQVVFIIDSSTDEPYLRQILQQSWEQMSQDSPNRLSSTGFPNLVRLNRLSAEEIQKLLHILSVAARSTAVRKNPAGSIQYTESP